MIFANENKNKKEEEEEEPVQSITYSDYIKYSKQILQNVDLHNSLLQQNQKISSDTNISSNINEYICYLIVSISIATIACIILFAIFYFTNNNNALYNYALMLLVVILSLACCLCSCLKYKCEQDKTSDIIMSSV